jgi:hypothetical protein
MKAEVSSSSPNVGLIQIINSLFYALLLSLTIRNWSLWTDEAFSAYIASHRTLVSLVSTLIHGDSSDLQTALYYIYLHGWEQLFGSSEVALRLSNVPFLFLFAFTLIWISSRVFRSRWLWILPALHPFLWFYAPQLRVYFALVTLSLLSFGCLLAYLDNPSQRERRVFPWIVVATILLGSAFDMLMLLALAPMATLVLSELFGKSRGAHQARMHWKDWKRPVMSLVLPFLALLGYFGWTLGRGTAYDYVLPNLRSMFAVLYRFFGLLGYGPNRRYDIPFRPYLMEMIVGGAIGFLALALLVIRGWKTSRTRSLFLALGVGLIQSVILSVVIKQQIDLRHIASLIPLMLLLPTIALADLLPEKRTRVVTACSVLLGAVWLVGSFHILFSHQYKNENFRAAVEKAIQLNEAAKGEIVVVGDPAASAYYGLELNGSSPCFPFTDDCSHALSKVDWPHKARATYAMLWERPQIATWLTRRPHNGPLIILISQRPWKMDTAWWPILMKWPHAVCQYVQGFCVYQVETANFTPEVAGAETPVNSTTNTLLPDWSTEKTDADQGIQNRTPSNKRSSGLKLYNLLNCTPCLAVALSLFMPMHHAGAQVFTDPATNMTFGQAIQGMQVLNNYDFGTGPGKTVTNLQELAASFNPYGIAGTTVINQEWERYQPFNHQNFVFTNQTLDLTATIAPNGGLWPGGINSGQIWTKQMYTPDRTGYTVYAFEVRMKVPSGPGMWPAAWFYAMQPGQTDGSEIDNPEFMVMNTQNQFDWTGYQHGPGQGAQLYSIKTNQWVWHPGLDFSADYHDYQTFWTPDAVYKYVDGTLVYAQSFRWTSPGPAQLGVNLAVGNTASAGMRPTSLKQFPSALSIDHITIWAK